MDETWIILTRLMYTESDYRYALWLYWQHNGTEVDSILAAQLKGEQAC